jgi:hypothetical protein
MDSVDDLPPHPNQTDGYLVLLNPERALAKWQLDTAKRRRDTDPAKAGQWQAYFSALRDALPSVDPSRYKGISRYPVERYAGNLPGPNELAELRIHELYGDYFDSRSDWQAGFDGDLLPTLDIAREILELTDTPSDHEIIRVARDDMVPGSKTLGFDIGYWGSDHSSIIADAMIMPLWHPCPEDELGALASWGSRLNDHMLFPTAADAVGYRNWYRTRSWAESEGMPNEFQIIRADIVP